MIQEGSPSGNLQCLAKEGNKVEISYLIIYALSLYTSLIFISALTSAKLSGFCFFLGYYSSGHAREYEEFEQDMKATEEEYSLHQRIGMRNDRTAFEELVNSVYNRLVNDIIGSVGPRVDPHCVEEAVGQALLDYRERPDRYNPRQHTLYSYLHLIAYRDVLNIQRKELPPHGIHQVSLSDPAVVDELGAAEGPEDVESVQAAKDLWSLIEPTFRDDRDKKLALLVINRARPFEIYARLLQIEHLPKAEQQKIVEREKNRITKHLRRLGESFHE